MDDFLWAAKLAVIVLFLLYSKILNRFNLALYVFGVMLLAAIFPEKSFLMPELALLASTIAFAAYLLLHSSIIHLKNFQKAGIHMPPERIRFHYLNPFLSMFTVSALFFLASVSGGSNFAISFLTLLAIPAGSNYALEKMPPLRHIDRSIVALFMVLAATILEEYAILFYALKTAAIYIALLSGYYFIKSAFTRRYKINLLKAGMLPAETIIRTNGKYRRIPAPFSIYAAAKSRIWGRCKNREVVSFFSILTPESIRELKKAKRSGKIEDISIQKTVDFKAFLIMGLVLTFFFIKTA